MVIQGNVRVQRVGIFFLIMPLDSDVTLDLSTYCFYFIPKSSIVNLSVTNQPVRHQAFRP